MRGAAENIKLGDFVQNGAEPDSRLDEKPFRLVKSFSLVAMVLIFAASLTLAAVVSHQAELIITKRVEDDTIKLMENLNYQLLYDFQLVAVKRFGRVHLGDEAQLKILNDVIGKTIYGFDISRVQIYNLEGLAVYSTERPLSELPAKADDMAAYSEAIGLYRISASPVKRFSRADSAVAPKLDSRVEDERPSGFLSGLFNDEALEDDEEDSVLAQARSLIVNNYEGGDYLLWKFFPQGRFILRSYKAMTFNVWLLNGVPVVGGVWDIGPPPPPPSKYGEGARKLSGVLELNRDLTPEFRQIAKLQYFALALAVFLSLFLIVVLRWVVSRGEAIITKRNQERQMLQARLGQAERLAGLGSMVATVAHEIRNPLGIIHSTADLLARFLRDKPEQFRLAGNILEEANRLSEVVTEFLDFARPLTIKLEPVIVEDILEEILAFLEVTLARNGVEVRTRLRAEPTETPGDAGMLRRAFLNILVNAIQAMGDGGLLTISTALTGQGDDARLSVVIEDTGPGLSDEAVKKIFSPFFTTKAKGTGLGLVIVRNIIVAHGGDIELISGEPSAHEFEDGAGPGLKVVINLKIS
ncbi:MAG: hypothetical protein LBS31_01250 [Candidatus Adiutrix sp.]|nr:hypothetical protein [Candidatus Adiutrix sp.]